MNSDHTEYEGSVLNIDKASVRTKLASLGAELVAKIIIVAMYLIQSQPLRAGGLDCELMVKRPS